MKKYERIFSSRVGVSIIVNTRKIAEEYRLTHWAQVLQDRTQSGLSIKAYCKQHGICGNTYFYWQRRVRAAAASELSLRIRNEPGSPTTSFREVELAEQAARSTATEMTAPSQLHISMGEMHLTVDSAYPVEQLSQLLQALTRPC